MKADEWQQAAVHLQTIGDCLRWTATLFAESPGLHFGHGTDEPWDEAVQLVVGALHVPEDRLQTLLAARLLPNEVQRLLGLARQRVEQHVPVAYLTGRAWFAGMELRVDPRVLVPRSPIAELIERSFAPYVDTPPARVLDLCTGSGAIGLGCAWVFPDAEVLLTDVSSGALEVAVQNRDRLGFSAARVRCREGDLFDAVDGVFDLIVSNPPYVPESSYARLPAEYLHEPKLGLTAEQDGLAIAQRILLGAASYLTPAGWLFLEVGEIVSVVDRLLSGVPFEWVSFERGGDGVLAIQADALKRFAATAHSSR